MSKHTPGPWITKECIGGWQQFGANGITPVRTHLEDNAHLIAAAPELLEALQAAVEAIEDLGCHPSCTDAANEAIAKATGEPTPEQ
jgi:hypothetical protein